jgi:hypothetical protein
MRTIARWRRVTNRICGDRAYSDGTTGTVKHRREQSIFQMDKCTPETRRDGERGPAYAVSSGGLRSSGLHPRLSRFLACPDVGENRACFRGADGNTAGTVEIGGFRAYSSGIHENQRPYATVSVAGPPRVHGCLTFERPASATFQSAGTEHIPAG